MAVIDRGHLLGCNGKRKITFVTAGSLRGYVCPGCKRVSLTTETTTHPEDIRYVPIAEILLLADELKQFDPEAERVLEKSPEERKEYNRERWRVSGL